MPAQSPTSSLFPSPEIYVVEASAGSGKTYALARRYVRLLLQLSRQRETPPIHSILAITFTNKAAFEMRERILRFLKELALGLMPVDEQADMLVGLKMSSDEAKKISGEVIGTILRNFNYFQVQTIDRFINALLVGSAFQIGLTANFRIKTSSRDHLAKALDALVDEAAVHQEVRKLFDDFLTSMLLVEARSVWTPKEVILDTVQQLFGEYNTYAREFACGGIRPEDMIKVKSALISEVKVFADRMPEGVKKLFVQSLQKFLSSHEKAFRFAQGLSAFFEAGKGIPWLKGAAPSPWHEDQWDRIQKGFVKAADLEVRHLYDPYLMIFDRVRQKLVEDSIREDILFLEELNAKARLVYEQGVAPEELYYRLATRFEHYLFDEFQDTSILQWENLRVLPEDAIARGGSLFYVGDKKQAIYSFRGGDTRLFDSVSGQYADPGYHLRRERLTKSRRSLRSLVDFNNEVFSLANIERLMRLTDKDGEKIIPARLADDDELKRVYEGARQDVVRDSPPGCVRVLALEGAVKEDVREDARAKVMPVIQDLTRRFSLSDIGILVRKNEEVEEVTRWLLEAGIPSSSERTLNIKEHVLIRQLVAFLKFLCSPVDNISFGEFIDGDIFLKASGLDREAIQDFILSWRSSRERSYLYMAFRQTFPREWEELIGDFFRNSGLYPFYETVASFYRRTGVLERFPVEQGFFMHFLDLVRAKEDEFPAMAEFLDHFELLEGEDLYVDVAGGDAVQIMTIHKAKGLEFQAVVLPFLTMSLDRKGAARKRALAYSLRTEGESLRLYHFNKTHTRYSALAEELDVEETMRTFFSELNNVYVALTRAACEMYVFIPPRSGQGRNLVADLVPEQARSKGDAQAVYPKKRTDDAGEPREVLPSACLDWIRFLKEEFPDSSALDLSAEKQKGLLFHAVLERVGNLDEQDIVMAIPAAVKDSLLFRPTFSSEDDLVNQITSFITAPAIRPFFFTKAAVFFCEKEFSDRFGHVRRMDRVLVFEKEVWVVDFKLGILGEEGADQVKGYMEILRDAFPEKRVKGFLLSFEEQAVKEIA